MTRMTALLGDSSSTTTLISDSGGAKRSAFSKRTTSTSSSMSGSTSASTRSPVTTIRSPCSLARCWSRRVALPAISPRSTGSGSGSSAPAWMRANWRTLVTRRSSRSVSAPALARRLTRRREVAVGRREQGRDRRLDRREWGPEVVGHRREERSPAVARRLRDASVEGALLGRRRGSTQPVHPGDGGGRGRGRGGEREQRHQILRLRDLE